MNKNTLVKPNVCTFSINLSNTPEETGMLFGEDLILFMQMSLTLFQLYKL